MVTTPSDGVETTWDQARAVLACIEQLGERHARLMAESPELSGAADRCADDALTAIEGIAAPLARWADALDDWAAAAERTAQARQTLAQTLIAQLIAANATTPAAIRDAVHAAMGTASPSSTPDLSEPELPDPELPTPDAPEDGPQAAAEDPDIAEQAAPADVADDISLVDAPPELPMAADAVVDAPSDPAPGPVTPAGAPVAAARAAVRPVSMDLGPSDSAEMSAAFDFPLHDLDPLAEASEEPSPFDFDDVPANDDLSTLQSNDLDDVIDATPELEVEDITMGSLGLMETSALSTDQVRAQLKKIRAERAAAAIAAQTDPPEAIEPVAPEVEPAQVEQVEPVGAEPVQVEPAQVEPGQVEPVHVEPVHLEPVQAEPAVEAPLVPELAMPDAAPSALPNTPDPVEPAPDAPRSGEAAPFPPLPRRPSGSLIEPSVVEVESGPIDVLDVRQLLGEPPTRPSRIDAAVRAALSSPPDAAGAPKTPRPATTDDSDWLEATPTSYPPASALQGAPAAESVEIELDSVDLNPADGELDQTVALQSVDLSAAMEAVNAEDWLDASQSTELLTSNQSLKALASDAEPAADDPWAALDISTHGELKAGHVSQARATRATLNVSIGVEYCGRFFTARSVNISSAGMLVTCDNDIADGERVDLFFEMPGGESIAVQATVCRSQQAAERRIALSFVNLRYDDRVVIDRYVTAQTA